MSEPYCLRCDSTAIGGLDDWEPIETAPKDGTWIMVGSHKYDHPFVVRWEPWKDGGFWREDDPGIYGNDLSNWPPTHWMPLPEPPKP